MKKRLFYFGLVIIIMCMGRLIKNIPQMIDIWTCDKIYTMALVESVKENGKYITVILQIDEEIISKEIYYPGVISEGNNLSVFYDSKEKNDIYTDDLSQYFCYMLIGNFLVLIVFSLITREYIQYKKLPIKGEKIEVEYIDTVYKPNILNINQKINFFRWINPKDNKIYTLQNLELDVNLKNIVKGENIHKFVAYINPNNIHQNRIMVEESLEKINVYTQKI